MYVINFQYEKISSTKKRFEKNVRNQTPKKFHQKIGSVVDFFIKFRMLYNIIFAVSEWHVHLGIYTFDVLSRFAIQKKKNIGRKTLDSEQERYKFIGVV